jgi:hypothetical protein
MSEARRASVRLASKAAEDIALVADVAEVSKRGLALPADDGKGGDQDESTGHAQAQTDSLSGALPKTSASFHTAASGFSAPATSPAAATDSGILLQMMAQQQQLLGFVQRQQEQIQALVAALKKPAGTADTKDARTTAETKDADPFSAAFAALPAPVLHPTKSTTNLLTTLKVAAGGGLKGDRSEHKAPVDSRVSRPSPAPTPSTAASAPASSTSTADPLDESPDMLGSEGDDYDADRPDGSASRPVIPVHDRLRVAQLLAFRDKHPSVASLQEVFKLYKLNSPFNKTELLAQAGLFDMLVTNGLGPGASGLELVARKIVGIWESDKLGLDAQATKRIAAVFTGDGGPPSILPVTELSEIYRGVAVQHTIQQKLRTIGASELARDQSKKPPVSAQKLFADNPQRAPRPTSPAAQHPKQQKRKIKKTKDTAASSQSSKAPALSAGAKSSSSGAKDNE